jgi:hypothetical protein
MRPTDHACRDLAKLHHDVAFGKAGGQIVWQPRIQCWITDKLFMDGKLPPPYAGCSQADVYRKLNCSNRLYDYNGCFRRVEDGGVSVVHVPVDETTTRHETKTPAGTLTSVTRKTPNSPREIRLKGAVTTAEDLRVAAWLEENATWEWNQREYERVAREMGDLGAPTMFMPRVNIQHMYINAAGVMETVYALKDCLDETEAYFRALDDCHDRLIDVINASPVDIINFGYADFRIMRTSEAFPSCMA